MDFFQSIRGVQFAEIVIRELPKLVKEIKRMNDLKEQELKEIDMPDADDRTDHLVKMFVDKAKNM